MPNAVQLALKLQPVPLSTFSVNFLNYLSRTRLTSATGPNSIHTVPLTRALKVKQRLRTSIRTSPQAVLDPLEGISACLEKRAWQVKGRHFQHLTGYDKLPSLLVRHIQYVKISRISCSNGKNSGTFQCLFALQQYRHRRHRRNKARRWPTGSYRPGKTHGHGGESCSPNKSE